MYENPAKSDDEEIIEHESPETMQSRMDEYCEGVNFSGEPSTAEEDEDDDADEDDADEDDDADGEFDLDGEEEDDADDE